MKVNENTKPTKRGRPRKAWHKADATTTADELSAARRGKMVRQSEGLIEAVKISEPSLIPLVPHYLQNAANRTHRDIVERLKSDGITPLEIMVHNMRFAHGRANEMYSGINGLLAQPALGFQEREKLMEYMREHVRWINLSQQYAGDAAPYMHPKLATVELNTNENKSISIIQRIIVDSAISSAAKTGAVAK